MHISSHTFTQRASFTLQINKRSNKSLFLIIIIIIGSTTKQFGFSFAFDAPTVWNSFPEDIRASPTIASFRKKLKTYLYAKAYPP